MPTTFAAGKYHRRVLRDDPLYKNRKTLLTTQKWLSKKKAKRLDELFSFDKDYVALQLMWQAYQGITDCYNMADKRRAKTMMREIVDQMRLLKGQANRELAQLGRSLHKRIGDILAYFDVGISNGPVETING